MVILERIVRQIGMSAGHHHVRMKEHVLMELLHITVVAQMGLLVNYIINLHTFPFNKQKPYLV